MTNELQKLKDKYRKEWNVKGKNVWWEKAFDEVYNKGYEDGTIDMVGIRTEYEQGKADAKKEFLSLIDTAKKEVHGNRLFDKGILLGLESLKHQLEKMK